MRLTRWFLCAFLLSMSSFLYSQEENQVIPSIQELIFPGQPEIKNNFNLFYEIHLNREDIPKPSYWYKIIFSKDCDFEFTLFPLYERDHYEFYLYRVAGNTSFCEAIDKDRVSSLNDYKYYKKYNDNQQSASFRASLVHVKPIPVKAGDAIYLEVLATEGKDCGHIFDCRTSESSLVTKVINDNCESITPIYRDSIQEVEARKEAAALRYLSDLFCIERKETIAFTAIRLQGDTRTVKQQRDFVEYSKKEGKNKPKVQVSDSTTISSKKKGTKPIIKSLTKVVSKSKEEHNSEPSILDKVLKERARIADSLEQLETKQVKSTADLNKLPELTPHHTLYDAKGEKRVSRIEVDKVLFSLLLKDLEIQRSEKKETLRLQYARFRKLGKKDIVKRRAASRELKKIKEEKKSVEARISTTKIKIKSIERLIAKQDYTLQENFIFNKSIAEKEDEVVYKIQIGAYKNKISPEIFKGLSPVSEDAYEGGVRYSVGAFPKFNYAKQAKEHVMEIGLNDAFIVAYFRDERISIQDALQLER